MEEVTKCSYINCADSQEKEQIFHELPVCDIRLCVKWLINSGHEDLIGKDFNTLRSMKFFICNNHFTTDCYLSKGTLKENAVPRPHWNSILTKRERQARNFSHLPKNATIRCSPIETNQNDRLDAIQCDSNTKDLSNGKDSIPNGEWCRTCATKKPNLVSMIVKNKKTEMSLLSKLKLLIEIDDEDTLPLSMCWECVRKLEQSFQFFQQIYIADNTLRHIFPISAHSKARSIQSSTPLKSRSTNDERLQGKSNNSNVLGSCSTINRSTWRTAVIEGKSRAPTIKPAIISKSICLNKKRPSGILKKVVHSNKSAELNENTRETVLSLFKDPSYDQELHWVDVLRIMKQHNRQKSTSVHSSVPLQLRLLVTCEFCNAKFRLRKQLKSHLVEQHLKQTDNMCKDCIICYDNKSLLLNHRAIYHKEKRYNCDYCQCCFIRKSKLRKHINWIHVNEICYSCDVCNEKFKAKEDLFEHIEALHLNTNNCSNSSSSSSSTPSSTSSIDHRSTKTDVTKREDPQCNDVITTASPDPMESSTTTETTAVTTEPIPATTLTTATTCIISTTASESSLISTNGHFCSECKKPLDEARKCSKCSVVEVPLKRCRTEYHCEECSLFVTNAEELAAHFKSHTNTTLAPPSPCFKTKESGAGGTHCDECNIELCGIDDFRVHRMQCHMMKQKDFTCLFCENSTFFSSEDYEKHIDFHCKQAKAPT